MDDSARLSPDGQWLWTGAEWIPAPPSAVSPVGGENVPASTERPWYAMSIGELRRRSVRAQIVFAVVVTLVVFAVVVIIGTLAQEERESDYQACLDRSTGVSEMHACARYLND